MADLLDAVRTALGGPAGGTERLAVVGPPVTLASAFPVPQVGAAAVGASLLAATLGTGWPVEVDIRGLAVALRSERYVLRDGRPAGSLFGPLSASHRTADGRLRLHVNYPWHRDAALSWSGCWRRRTWW